MLRVGSTVLTSLTHLIPQQGYKGLVGCLKPSTLAIFGFGIPPSHLVRVHSNNGIPYFRRNMRTFNVSFFAVLSCIAMIGATPIGNRSPEAPVPNPVPYIPYVTLQQLREVLI